MDKEKDAERGGGKKIFEFSPVYFRKNSFCSVFFSLLIGSSFGNEAQRAKPIIDSDPVMEAIKSDKRLPSEFDLSGVWWTGSDLAGQTLQIEQRGVEITGRGYHWTCGKTSPKFQASGSYKGGVLTLTFVEAAGRESTRTFVCAIEAGQLRLLDRTKGHALILYPYRKH